MVALLRRDLYRRLRVNLLLLPVSVGAVVVDIVGRHKTALRWQQQLAERAAGRGLTPRLDDAGRSSVLGYSIIAALFGMWFWLLFVLAIPNTIRCVCFYWLTDYLVVNHGHIGSGTWGGPTLVGAWATHGILALLLVPVWISLFYGLTVVQTRLADRLLGGSGRHWPIGISLLVIVVEVALGYALTHQT